MKLLVYFYFMARRAPPSCALLAEVRGHSFSPVLSLAHSDGVYLTAIPRSELVRTSVILTLSI